MDTRTAARRWAETWRTNWIARKPEPIVALYAPGATYASEPFRAPRIGPEGARDYVVPTLAEEADVQARFGEPIVEGDRAAICWWASFVEDGDVVTYAGTSNLRFNEAGLVVDEWDTWNRADGRLEPPTGWGRG